MSLLVGDQTVVDVYIGENPVLKIYKGDVLIKDFTLVEPDAPTDVSISVEDDI